MDKLEQATIAAWRELKRQLPDTEDFSDIESKPPCSLVRVHDGFDLKAVVAAALNAL